MTKVDMLNLAFAVSLVVAGGVFGITSISLVDDKVVISDRMPIGIALIAIGVIWALVNKPRAKRRK